MNKLFLINNLYYVMAFDYYDAIMIFQKYKNNYSEDIIQTIEAVASNVICKNNLDNEEDEENKGEYDE